MDIIKEYEFITNRYENELFNIIKTVIDEALVYARSNNLNPVDSFVYINDRLLTTYVQFAISKEIISDEKQFNKSHIKYIISEKLSERIDEYMNPIILNTKEYIVKMANDLLDSTTLDELQEKYDILMSLLSNKVIQENSYLYENIELRRFI